MRYFARLAYNGTRYHGWQSQKNDSVTVQEVLEENFSKVARETIEITGCGRTDTGVHASEYFFHFDSEYNWVDSVHKLNRMLPADIVIYSIQPVEEGDHARYDAISRSYIYRLHTFKDPFNQHTSTFYPYPIVDLNLFNEALALLLEYDEFYPFCKSKSGLEHFRCSLESAYWKRISNHHYEMHITSNRFLRGMVRLIVGMCMRMNEGKINLQDLKSVMDLQVLPNKRYAAPPAGLYLSKIVYPDRIMQLFA